MDDLGFCWACVIGTLVYNAPCDWYVCDNCGYTEQHPEIAAMIRGAQVIRRA